MWLLLFWLQSHHFLHKLWSDLGSAWEMKNKVMLCTLKGLTGIFFEGTQQ